MRCRLGWDGPRVSTVRSRKKFGLEAQGANRRMSTDLPAIDLFENLFGKLLFWIVQAMPQCATRKRCGVLFMRHCLDNSPQNEFSKGSIVAISMSYWVRGYTPRIISVQETKCINRQPSHCLLVLLIVCFIAVHR